MEPKVTLVSWTNKPVETVYSLWQASRGNEELLEVDKIDPEKPEVLDVFRKVVESKIPVSENLDFVFMLENVSVSFREQMVRQRIGVKVGERIGADVVPDLADSSWWSQSMRILDMGKFATERRYRTPESVKGKLVPVGSAGKFVEAELLYDSVMTAIEQTYNLMVKGGVPMEDAREIIPLGATHRISWKLNLAAIQHVIGKRGCWILQLGLWKPIIVGMVEELATKVHPYFRNLINPPCIGSDNKFHDCVFKLDNERRVTGEDALPPCSLYMYNHRPDLVTKEDNQIRVNLREDQGPAFSQMLPEYAALWKRNPFTGVPNLRTEIKPVHPHADGPIELKEAPEPQARMPQGDNADEPISEPA